MENSLKTAKEFYLKSVFPTSFENKPDEVELWFDTDNHAKEVVNIMIEFAKLHVQKALNKASKKSKSKEGQITDYKLTESILKSYSLDKIK